MDKGFSPNCQISIVTSETLKIKMADEITEVDFNRYRITKSEITVSLPALQEVFQTLWENEFPKDPWTNDRASVEKFEINVRKACQHRAESHKNQQQNMQKINSILASLQKDESWYKYDWDTSTLSKVLVDCRLFKLEEISVELSDNIKGIMAIRNKMAHCTTFGVETCEFEDTMKSLKKHLEGLKCVINADKHLQTVKELESQEKPTSRNQLKMVCQEIEIMKGTLKWFQEKEQRLLDRELFQKEKQELERDNNDLRAKLLSLQNEYDKLTTEKAHLQKEKSNLEVVKILQEKENIQLKKNNANLQATIYLYKNKMAQDKVQSRKDVKENLKFQSTAEKLKNKLKISNKIVQQQKIMLFTIFLLLFLILVVYWSLKSSKNEKDEFKWPQPPEQRITIHDKNLTNEVVFTLLREKQLLENSIRELKISSDWKKPDPLVQCCLQELSEFYQNSTLEKVHCKKSATYFEEKWLQEKLSNENLKKQYNIQNLSLTHTLQRNLELQHHSAIPIIQAFSWLFLGKDPFQNWVIRAEKLSKLGK